MAPVIVSMINLKGGVGKTTTTVQLAECLSAVENRRVLVIDLDPQTNASVTLIPTKRWQELDAQGLTAYQMFRDKLDGTTIFEMSKAIQKSVSNLTEAKTLSLLASNIDLIDIQDQMHIIAMRTNYKTLPMEVLKQQIEPFLDDYDFILIDCPPNLGLITQNGIEISDFYFIPTIPDHMSTTGLQQIIRKIHELSDIRKLSIRCLGLIITKYNSRSEVHEKMVAQLPDKFKNYFKDLDLPPSDVFESVIPLANQYAEVVNFTVRVSSFKDKYGHTTSGEKKLYEHIMALTEEFLVYAED